MSYATIQDVIARYGDDLLLILTDRDGDGAADMDVVDQALQDAAAEIDTYLAAKYQLPVTTTVPALVRVSVDIVVYRLAADRSTGTDEQRKRYEDAVSWLTKVSRGDVSLGLPKPPVSSNGAVFIKGPERRFKRH